MKKNTRSGRCALCDIEYPYLQRDHIVPRFEGGTSEADNIRYICPNCHGIKSHDEASRANKGRQGRVQSSEEKAQRSTTMKNRHAEFSEYSSRGRGFTGKKHSEEAKLAIKNTHLLREEVKKELEEEFYLSELSDKVARLEESLRQEGKL